jgi:hypothetical protein
MPVLIEAISVVIKRSAIEEKYPGGFAAFEREAPFTGPEDMFCADAELARIGLMAPVDSQQFCERLEALGFSSAREAVDVVVIDEVTGPTVPCDWVELVPWSVPGGTVTACRLAGSTDDMLVVPQGWTYADSATNTCIYVPGRAWDTLEYLRSEGSVDVVRDKLTGKVGGIGRPNWPDEAVPAARQLAPSIEAAWAAAAIRAARRYRPDLKTRLSALRAGLA